jgi:hypothetical protein
MLMHWFTLVVPVPEPPVPGVHTNPAPPTVAPCLPGPACETPAPPATIDQNYLGGFVPADVSAALSSELQRLRAQLPANAAAKLQNWSVSISNCSVSAPFIIVCKDASAHVIRIAPILVTAIFGDNVKPLLMAQQKLVSFGADPSSFDGSYQSVYGTHGLQPADWNAILSSDGAIMWQPLANSVDFVIAQQMASIYLAVNTAPPPTATQINLEAKAQVTAANGTYDATALTDALGHAAGKYQQSTWGYEHAGDVQQVLGAIPPAN